MAIYPGSPPTGIIYPPMGSFKCEGLLVDIHPGSPPTGIIYPPMGSFKCEGLSVARAYSRE